MDVLAIMVECSLAMTITIQVSHSVLGMHPTRGTGFSWGCLLYGKDYHPGIEMFADCLHVSSDKQNVFSPVSTNIQLDQFYLNINQLRLYNH